MTSIEKFSRFDPAKLVIQMAGLASVSADQTPAATSSRQNFSALRQQPTGGGRIVDIADRAWKYPRARRAS